jgi:enoyl-CoA hydratase/carnithine racemase
VEIMAGQRLEVRQDGAVAIVELARPDKLNAMDGEMFAAIGDTFRRLRSDPAVRCIVLAGQGRHFTAGLDLDMPRPIPARRRMRARPPRRACATSNGCRTPSTRSNRRACRWWRRCTAPALGQAST